MSDITNKRDNPPDNKNSETNSGPLEIGPIRRNGKGQFLAGSVPNPKGRPSGSRNRSNLLARVLLEERSAEITRKVMDEAIAGNPIAYKLCMERLVAIPRDEPVDIKLPDTSALFEKDNPSRIFEAHNALLKSMAQGDITPHEAQVVSNLLEARRRSWEALEMHKRMTDLEQNAAEEKQRRTRK